MAPSPRPARGRRPPPARGADRCHRDGRDRAYGPAGRSTTTVYAPPTPRSRRCWRPGLRSGIAAPLWARGSLWGALTAGSERRRPSARRRAAPSGLRRAPPPSRCPTRRRAPSSPTGCRDRPAYRAANRRAFRERLDGEVMRAQRHGHLLTLAIIDIDDFKGDQRHLRPPGRATRCWPRSGGAWAPPGARASWWRASAARSSPGSSPRSTRRGGLVAAERARKAIAEISVEGIEGVTCSVGPLRSEHGGRRGRAAAAGRPGPLPGQGRGPRPGGVGRPLMVAGGGPRRCPARAGLR